MKLRFCANRRKIPEFIEIDVSGLGVNESVHISDLKVGKGIEIHEAADTMIASVVVIKGEAEPEAPGTGSR